MVERKVTLKFMREYSGYWVKFPRTWSRNRFSLMTGIIPILLIVFNLTVFPSVYLDVTSIHLFAILTSAVAVALGCFNLYLWWSSNSPLLYPYRVLNTESKQRVQRDLAQEQFNLLLKE